MGLNRIQFYNIKLKMKLISLALIATVSAFNVNQYDVDINGNIFKKPVMPHELTQQDIKNYKLSLM